MAKFFTRCVLGALLSVGICRFAIAATANPDAQSGSAKVSQQLPSGALAGASSVYLRDAAAQQIRWQPYDPGSFALAKRLNRPVLIDIGAMWCHWCHVMDQKTYADPQVAGLINQFLRADQG
jgi:thiol:disulfide interchange protein